MQYEAAITTCLTRFYQYGGLFVRRLPSSRHDSLAFIEPILISGGRIHSQTAHTLLSLLHQHLVSDARDGELGLKLIDTIIFLVHSGCVLNDTLHLLSDVSQVSRQALEGLVNGGDLSIKCK